MENKTKLNEQQIIELLNDFVEWNNGEYDAQARELDKYIKEKILNAELLNDISDEELISNLYEGFVLKLDGPVHRTATKEHISQHINDIKRNIKYIIESNDDCFVKAQKVLEGEYQIVNLSKSFWTPILQAECKEVLPNWNNKTENFFKKIGIDLKNNKLTLIEKYKIISDTFLYFKKLDNRQDFFTLNHLMHYGTEIEEGINKLEDLIIISILYQFIQQAATDDLTTKKYKTVYREMNVAASFGQGIKAQVPWIGFVDSSITGVSVNYLYFKDKQKLILAYGISEEKPPVGKSWKLSADIQTIQDYFQENFQEQPPRYGTSFVYKAYDIENFDKLDKEHILNDLNLIIKEFKNSFKNIVDKQYWIIAAGNSDEQWDYFVQNNIIAISWNELGDLTKYKNKDDIKTKLYEKYPDNGTNQMNNALACYQFANDIKQGDIIFVKSEKLVLLGYGEVISDYVFNDKSQYQHIRKIKWKKIGKWIYKSDELKSFAPKTLTNITKYEGFAQSLLDLINNKEIRNNNMNKISKNTILYGPPGTGKTYNTVDKALQITDPEFWSANQNNRKALKEKFAQLQKEGRIDFVTFHQSYGYEEFVEGLKANTDNGDISYEVVDGIFKKMVIESMFDNLEFDNFEEDLTYAELYDVLIEAFKKEHVLKLKSKDDKEIEIREISRKNNLYCYHGKSNVRHTVGKERLKKLYNKYNSLKKLQDLTGFHKEFTDIIGGADQTVYWAVLNELLKYKEHIKKENFDNEITFENITYEKKKEMIETVEKKKFKNDTKKYILIIDEINRGNISKIFGELITLIEESKRAGADDETIVTLPYSGEEFVVPSNLYIIGTMNTADRSIALLDTALRRRFDFEELMPKYDILEKEIDGINIGKFLQALNERIEIIFDRDHMIGHAYFINIKTKEELDGVMKNKIIPLLQEYFYDDWEKIQIVLGDFKTQKIDNKDVDDADRFVISKNVNENKVLGFEYEDIDEEQKIFEIKDNFTNQAYTKVYGYI